MEAMRHCFFLMLFCCVALVAGCASLSVDQAPLGQDIIDSFAASAKDARYFGITVYQYADGPHFEFANRSHRDRGAQVDFRSKKSAFPVVKARSFTFVDFDFLIDSSARQSWLLFKSVPALSYTPFDPLLGEYPDHVVSEYPGYAGVSRQIVLDTFHLENPIFYVPPADGGLGTLSRNPKYAGAAEKAVLRHPTVHAVMGYAMMKAFSYLKFDFPGRTVRVSAHSTYKPASGESVLAQLPLLSWRGRPVLEAHINGHPVGVVVDTAGDFGLSFPNSLYRDDPVTVQLGDWLLEDVPATTHEEMGLPDDFPVRLGLKVLSHFIVTFDIQNNCLWIENPSLNE